MTNVCSEFENQCPHIMSAEELEFVLKGELA